jgi:hypothetical protein
VLFGESTVESTVFAELDPDDDFLLLIASQSRSGKTTERKENEEVTVDGLELFKLARRKIVLKIVEGQETSPFW